MTEDPQIFTDVDAVQQFTNFLSWGERPLVVMANPGGGDADRRRLRPVPPAWWAYALGETRWCPPKGEW